MSTNTMPESKKRFFSYCPENGVELYATAEEAAEATCTDIAYYRDDCQASGEWSDEVDDCYWGEVKERATATEPNEEGGVDFTLQPIAPETMFLVHAGGDGYQASIVPESGLDKAYLLTQWCTLDPADIEAHDEALAHFHDDDAWTHEEPTGKGKRLKFSLALEDGWIEVVRLPAA
jgi:hypothetical protein